MVYIYLNLVFSYIKLLLFTAISSFFEDLAPRLGNLRAGIKLHLKLLAGVLRAPLAFFDTTPLGRVLARFSKDIEVLDNSLPQNVSDTVYCTFEVNHYFIFTHDDLTFFY